MRRDPITLTLWLLTVALFACSSQVYAQSNRIADVSRNIPANDWRQLWPRAAYDHWHNKPESDLKSLAAKGSPAAQFILWDKWKQERKAEAEAMLDASANAGFPQAMFEKGFTLLTTQGKPRPEKLAGWAMMEKAAATGYPYAKLTVAEYDAGFINSPEVQPNFKRALAYFRDVAETGNPASMTALAQFYSSGVGEPRKESESPHNLLIQAANKGNRTAMQHLSNRYLFGHGERTDLLEAARWLYLSVVRSDHPFDLEGLLDENGEPKLQPSIPRSELASLMSLYLRIARGEHQATIELAERYRESGKLGHAANLFRLAVRKGSKAAAARLKSIEPSLSSEQKVLAEDDTLFPFSGAAK